MGNVESYVEIAARLTDKVKELEQEMELKDEMHLEDLRRLRHHLHTIMKKYHVD